MMPKTNKNAKSNLKKHRKTTVSDSKIKNLLESI
jgi:hypothetical protein